MQHYASSCHWAIYMNMNFILIIGTVETQDTLRILGVILDSKLNFKTHIKEQLKIACAKANLCGEYVRKFNSKDAIVRLYKAYVLPHLEYFKILVLFFWVLVLSKLIKWRTLLFIKINFKLVEVRVI